MYLLCSIDIIGKVDVKTPSKKLITELTSCVPENTSFTVPLTNVN